MPTVGDALLTVKELIPDMPPTFGAAVATFAVVTATGSTLPAGAYFVQATQFNDFGETSTSAESASLTIAANQGIQVTSTLLPGATKIRAYFTQAGGVSGNENQFAESTTSPFTISAPGVAGTPPTRSTAFLPEADGNIFSSTSLYRWLNEALNQCSRLSGGLLDYSGVPTVVGQPLYVVTGEWLTMTDVWYDGYGLGLDVRGSFFRRNTVPSSVLRSATVSLRTDRVVIEVWPQPNRTAASTTTSASMTTTDTSASLTSTTGFLLPFGFAQIGTEIVSYKSTSGNVLGGLIRGLGGTTPTAWASGTAVNEVNLFFNGKREFTTKFVPGDATKTLFIPSGWFPLLSVYILSRAREVEQDGKEAQRLRQQFEAEIISLNRSNRQLAGPRQIPARGAVLETVPGYGTYWGGVILP